MATRGSSKLQLGKHVYGARYDRFVFDSETLRISPVGEPRPLTAAEERDVLAAAFRFLRC